jgi:uncharacterized protein YgiM (DUF1202 family)
MSLALAALLLVTFDETARPAPETALRIQAIRGFELLHGRTEATWNALSQARLQVRDSIYPPTQLPLWLDHAYRILLSWQFPIFILILGGGSIVALHLWRGCRIRHGSIVPPLSWAAAWFLMLACLLLAIHPDPRPQAVVATDATPLRLGNGISYSVQLYHDTPIRLAAGLEVLIRTSRDNGWTQIELPDGRLGWVPTSALLSIGGGGG